jgi:hypothetical protein
MGICQPSRSSLFFMIVTDVAEYVIVVALVYLRGRSKMVIRLECENVLLARPRDGSFIGLRAAAGNIP